MMSMSMPEAEANVDSSLVHALLQQQRPDLADLPLVELATAGTTWSSGWGRSSPSACPDASQRSNWLRASSAGYRCWPSSCHYLSRHRCGRVVPVATIRGGGACALATVSSAGN